MMCLGKPYILQQISGRQAEKEPQVANSYMLEMFGG